MPRATFAALLVPACALLASCASAPPPEQPPQKEAPQPEWVQLFNGDDLTGWTQRGGKAGYRIEDRCIVGATRPNQPNSFLCTLVDFENFELELDFRADPESNSGIQIRSQSLPEYQDGRVHGYQVEIDTTSRAWTGGIYDEGRRGWLAPLDQNPEARAAFKPGEWNHFRIIADGDTISTWLNGVPAARLEDTMTPRGFIALQVHGVGERTDELLVRWRNIRLRLLE